MKALTFVGFFLFVFFLRKDLEKHHVQAFLAAFPKWQDNFVFCFVTYSVLTNHHAMITESFSYQRKAISVLPTSRKNKKGICSKK